MKNALLKNAPAAPASDPDSPKVAVGARLRVPAEVEGAVRDAIAVFAHALVDGASVAAQGPRVALVRHAFVRVRPQRAM